MKYTIHFLLTCFISTGALLGATKAANPYPYFTVMIVVWTLFAWRAFFGNRRKSNCSSREEAFREYMRSKMDD